MKWELRCSECGKFIKKPYDVGNRWGGSQDVDPPDPSFFCKDCAVKLMQVAKAAPEELYGESWWETPKYIQVARELLKEG